MKKNKDPIQKSVYDMVKAKGLTMEDLMAPTVGVEGMPMSDKEAARAELMAALAGEDSGEAFSQLQRMLSEVKRQGLTTKDLENIFKLRQELGGGRSPDSTPPMAGGMALPPNIEALIRLKEDMARQQTADMDAPQGYLPQNNMDMGGMDFQGAQAILQQLRSEINPPKSASENAQELLQAEIDKGKKAGKMKSIIQNIQGLLEMTEKPYP